MYQIVGVHLATQKNWSESIGNVSSDYKSAQAYYDALKEIKHEIKSSNIMFSFWLLHKK